MVEAILNSGKEVLEAAESQTKPSRGMVIEPEEATAALDEAATELDRVTAEVEESLQELQGRESEGEAGAPSVSEETPNEAAGCVAPVEGASRVLGSYP